jgi:hypothetical protein
MRFPDTRVIFPDANYARRIGRIASAQRETYDTDLHRFQEQAGKQFAAWFASLDKHQSRTDIFGALDAARQQFAVLPNGMNLKFVVVTDFLEDDGIHIQPRRSPFDVAQQQMALLHGRSDYARPLDGLDLHELRVFAG